MAAGASAEPGDAAVSVLAMAAEMVSELPALLPKSPKLTPVSTISLVSPRMASACTVSIVFSTVSLRLRPRAMGMVQKEQL
jgi:hypothetical protein